MNELTLKEIAEYYRKKYPDAIKVSLDITYHGVNETVTNHLFSTETHFTIRNLGGKWVEVNK